MPEPRDALEADPVEELHRYREELSKKYPTPKELREYYETVPTAEEFLEQTAEEASKDEDLLFALATERSLPPRDALEADPVEELHRYREELSKKYPTTKALLEYFDTVPSVEEILAELRANSAENETKE